MNIERRYFDATELRADGDKPLIHGYAVVYGQTSVPIWNFREIIEPGAFATASESDVFALWQHDSAAVLGRTKAGTLRLYEDDRGVRFEVDVADTSLGRDALETIRRGDIDNMSFGFRVLPDGVTWTLDDDGTEIRHVTNASLLEVSPVTWAAYPQTTVDARQDEIYGVIPEIPEELRAQRFGHSKTDRERVRAHLDRLKRYTEIAERE